uniref:Uncharacterized protein n=2 Tax=viral metagenome TaxID=1070528 RepID=A0A6H1ZYF2_9ZZZZ
MVMEWRNKTCRVCIYCVDMECRKFPPILTGWSQGYPTVAGFIKFKPACSYYQINPTHKA